jgi:SAM-dependent methyltransferase
VTDDLEQLANEHGALVADELGTAARRGGTEGDFRREAERVFDAVTSAVGLTVTPHTEYSVAHGRVDAVYNRLIIEYKKPGTIRPGSARSNSALVNQVKGYIEEVASREHREAQRLAGVALDGYHFLFVRRVGEGWSLEDPVPVNSASTSRFLRLLFSLATGHALIVENLIERFGPATYHARRAVKSLYDALNASPQPLVKKLFEQWRIFFSEATDYGEWASRLEGKTEFRSFVRGMNLDPEKAEPSKVFYVIHTYYALLVKLIASMATAQFAGGSTTAFSRLAAQSGDELRKSLDDLEGGGVFGQYGIRNFLEGDFFRWYVSAWSPEVEVAIGGMIQRLAEFDPEALELAPENARDLLKKLYHGLLPREIRHDLGEYYTPDWLAERVIRSTLGLTDLGKADRRVLDPACGSGTFLVILIKHIKDRQERNRKDPSETLELILKNVVGFDLNPLAVIAARTNYLLALGDLLKHRKGDVTIPVYQADSVLAPSRGAGFEGDVFILNTAVGQFRIPALFAEREKLDVLTNVVKDYVKADLGEEAFIIHVSSGVGLDPQDVDAVKHYLAALYRDLRELHKQEMDGIWAGIIRNAFAPLFVEPCHYVVGNPPWVNWESLPDEYRRDTKPLWEHYGLFPHSGMDVILGKGKKDISMLMTYVSMDKYLRPGGKLGFLLSQSMFKTSGAGQGFRRFVLPDGTMFGPLLVEDMVELHPFEGATNRTAWALFLKGREVTYPVPYSRFRKVLSGRGSGIGFDTPYEEVIENRITYSKWHAEPVDPSNATAPWIAAREWATKALRKVTGKSPYRAHEGSNTGGANGVFWVEITGERPGGLVMISNITERAKRKVQQVHAAVEPDLLYPLVRGRDVRRWSCTPSAYILMTQDPATRTGLGEKLMAREYPRTYAYLQMHRSVLQSRKTQVVRHLTERGAFYSIFGVGEYTLSPWKVVWREVSNEVDAAVVNMADSCGAPRPVVPDHTCILVACETRREAHYVCAVLNSSPARLAIRNYIVLHPDPHVLEHINVPKYHPEDEIRRRLAELSEDGHLATTEGRAADVVRIEQELDVVVARLWGLSDREMADIQASLREV